MTSEERISIVLAEISMLERVRESTLELADSLLIRLAEAGEVDAARVFRVLRNLRNDMPLIDTTAASLGQRLLLEDLLAVYGIDDNEAAFNGR